MTWVLKPTANVSGKICVVERLAPSRCQKVAPCCGTSAPGSTAAAHSEMLALALMRSRLRWMTFRSSVGASVPVPVRGVAGLSSFFAMARRSSIACNVISYLNMLMQCLMAVDSITCLAFFGFISFHFIYIYIYIYYLIS